MTTKNQLFPTHSFHSSSFHFYSADISSRRCSNLWCFCHWFCFFDWLSIPDSNLPSFNGYQSFRGLVGHRCWLCSWTGNRLICRDRWISTPPTHWPQPATAASAVMNANWHHNTYFSWSPSSPYFWNSSCWIGQPQNSSRRPNWIHY